MELFLFTKIHLENYNTVAIYFCRTLSCNCFCFRCVQGVGRARLGTRGQPCSYCIRNILDVFRTYVVQHHRSSSCCKFDTLSTQLPLSLKLRTKNIALFVIVKFNNIVFKNFFKILVLNKLFVSGCLSL